MYKAYFILCLVFTMCLTDDNLKPHFNREKQCSEKETSNDKTDFHSEIYNASDDSNVKYERPENISANAAFLAISEHNVHSKENTDSSHLDDDTALSATIEAPVINESVGTKILASDKADEGNREIIECSVAEEINDSEMNAAADNDYRSITENMTEINRELSGPVNMLSPAENSSTHSDYKDENNKNHHVITEEPETILSEIRTERLVAPNTNYNGIHSDPSPESSIKISSLSSYITKSSESDETDYNRFVDYCDECDMKVLPIQPPEQQAGKYQSNRNLYILPSAAIQFDELPQGDELQIETFGLSEGLPIFTYLNEFLSWIQPNDFPIEFVRDVIRDEKSLFSLIVEVEAGFIACLAVSILAALFLPCVILSRTCSKVRRKKTPNSPSSDTSDSGWAGNCTRRTLVFIIQLVLLLLTLGMALMFITNEQLSASIRNSTQVLQTALSDSRTFLYNSHLQLHFVATRSLDQAIQASYADLENVESLLGVPIQEELIQETGLDVALDSLTELIEKTKSTSLQVDNLLNEIRTTQEMVSATRDRLLDLRHQVEIFRRQCPLRERSLCDTIDSVGLEIAVRFDRIGGDEKLKRIRNIVNSGLVAAVQDARSQFSAVPSKIDADTRDARQSIRRQLSRQRSQMDEDIRHLETFTRDLANKISNAENQMGAAQRHVDDVEFWRWLVCLCAATCVLALWLLLLSGISCGCCGSEKSAVCTFLVTVVLTCLLSFILWSVTLAGFLVGGHGEVFLCRPLYDEPEYKELTKILDRPGIFYAEDRGGLLSGIVYGNDTFDLSVGKIIEDCRRNKPAYTAFKMQRIFDVDSATDDIRWTTLRNKIDYIKVNLTNLQILTPHLNDQLGQLISGLSVNYTAHRSQVSGPLTGKDLNSFANQLESVGNQIKDLATASRMETLASRTRKLIASHIQPLQERKDRILYTLTSLEVQMGPLQRKANESLSQLKTIQFFLNSKGETIAQMKRQDYINRLLGYIIQFREHITRMANEKVAPCGPVWTLFRTVRLFMCKNIMDSVNGNWFSTFWCLMLLLISAPICLKLVYYYRTMNSCSSRHSGSPSEGLMNAEQPTGWSTPGESEGAGTW